MNLKHLISLLVFNFILVSITFAQNEIFKTISKDNLVKDDYTDNIIKNYSTIKGVSSVEFVEMEDILGVMDENELHFTLPNVENKSFLAKQDTSFVQGKDDFVWGGHLMTKDGKEGSMMIIRKSEYYMGYFQYENGYQHLIGLGGKQGMLINYGVDAKWECGNSGRKEGITTVEDLERSMSSCSQNVSCSGVIDVLCVFTEDAYQWMSGGSSTPTFWGEFSFTYGPLLVSYQTNQVFLNSLSGSKTIRIRAIKRFDINPPTSTAGTLAPTIENVIYTSIPANLATEYKADLVCLVCDKIFVSFAGISVGLLNDKPFFGIAAWAFMNPTFQHEFGHELDGEHQSPECTPCKQSCTRPHIWTNSGNSYRTIMYAPTDPTLTIPYYSSNSTTYLGMPTGISSSSTNNAKVINNNFCTVKNNQPEPSSLMININGQQSSCGLSFSINGVAGANIGNPPYTYKWEWKPVYGTSTYTVLNYEQTLTLSQPLSCNFYFIRGTIFSADGQYAYKDIKINHSWCSPYCINSLTGSTKNNGISMIYPNPSDNLFKFSIKSEKATVASYIINDLSGQVLYHGIQNLEKGDNLIDFDIKNLENGLYYLKIQYGNHNVIEKFIVNH